MNQHENTSATVIISLVSNNSSWSSLNKIWPTLIFIGQLQISLTCFKFHCPALFMTEPTLIQAGLFSKCDNKQTIYLGQPRPITLNSNQCHFHTNQYHFHPDQPQTTFNHLHQPSFPKPHLKKKIFKFKP
jgi:hypothetical protein